MKNIETEPDPLKRQYKPEVTFCYPSSIKTDPFPPHVALVKKQSNKHIINKHIINIINNQ